MEKRNYNNNNNNNNDNNNNNNMQSPMSFFKLGEPEIQGEGQKLGKRDRLKSKHLKYWKNSLQCNCVFLKKPTGLG